MEPKKTRGEKDIATISYIKIMFRFFSMDFTLRSYGLWGFFFWGFAKDSRTLISSSSSICFYERWWICRWFKNMNFFPFLLCVLVLWGWGFHFFGFMLFTQGSHLWNCLWKFLNHSSLKWFLKKLKTICVDVRVHPGKHSPFSIERDIDLCMFSSL